MLSQSSVFYLLSFSYSKLTSYIFFVRLSSVMQQLINLFQYSYNTKIINVNISGIYITYFSLPHCNCYFFYILERSDNHICYSVLLLMVSTKLPIFYMCWLKANTVYYYKDMLHRSMCEWHEREESSQSAEPLQFCQAPSNELQLN